VVRTQESNSAFLLLLRVVAIEIAPSAFAICVAAMPTLLDAAGSPRNRLLPNAQSRSTPHTRQVLHPDAAPPLVTASPDTHQSRNRSNYLFAQHGVVVHGEGWNRGDRFVHPVLSTSGPTAFTTPRLIAIQQAASMFEVWPRTNIILPGSSYAAL